MTFTVYGPHEWIEERRRKARRAQQRLRWLRRAAVMVIGASLLYVACTVIQAVVR